MRNMTEVELTQIVLNAYQQTTDPRLREILTSLVSHLHAFVREVRLTEPEWLKGINFITETGRISVGDRQEVILVSDLLGVSALVNMISAAVPEGATEPTVIGPFFVEGAPEKAWGESIDGTGIGKPMIVRGRVLDMEGRPVADALVDVWQTDADGMYDIQKADTRKDNLRGRYRTNADGEFLVRTVRPTSYPIPVDGPGGDLVRAANRHPWRPAHIHAMIAADGYENARSARGLDGGVRGRRDSAMRHDGPGDARSCRSSLHGGARAISRRRGLGLPRP
ncbi:MAG: dioxygenase [Sphingobium sp.]|nr:dioxygenase [Sphingobium sp.]